MPSKLGIITLDDNEAAEGKKLKPTLESLGVKVEVESLPFDLVIRGEKRTVVAERKYVTDFAASIRNRRLWDQCSALADFVPDCYLLLEGHLPIIQKVSKMKEKSILGMIDAVIDKFNVKIVPVPNMYWTALWIVRKAEELGEPKKETELSLRSSARKDVPDHIKALYVLEGALGPVTAKAILTKYGSLLNLINNIGYEPDKTYKDLVEIKLSSGKRIREKDIEKLFNILKAEYKENKNEIKD